LFHIYIESKNLISILRAKYVRALEHVLQNAPVRSKDPDKKVWKCIGKRKKNL